MPSSSLTLAPIQTRRGRLPQAESPATRRIRYAERAPGPDGRQRPNDFIRFAGPLASEPRGASNGLVPSRESAHSGWAAASDPHDFRDWRAALRDST